MCIATILFFFSPFPTPSISLASSMSEAIIGKTHTYIIYLSYTCADVCGMLHLSRRFCISLKGCCFRCRKSKDSQFLLTCIYRGILIRGNYLVIMHTPTTHRRRKLGGRGAPTLTKISTRGHYPHVVRTH